MNTFGVIQRNPDSPQRNNQNVKDTCQSYLTYKSQDNMTTLKGKHSQQMPTLRLPGCWNDQARTLKYFL